MSAVERRDGIKSFLTVFTSVIRSIINNTFSCSLQAVVTLDVGATFGESIVHDLPRDMTVCTKTTCELLRIHQNDFKKIWDVSKPIADSSSFTIV